MRLAVRSVLALFITAFITASPATASASEITFFDFVDGGGDGIIIWDGALDVATMQNSCPAQLCITTALGAITPEALQMLVSMASPVTFAEFIPQLALSLPNGGFPLADCATYSIICQPAETVMDNFGGNGIDLNGFECLDNGALPPGGDCPDDAQFTHTVALLPLTLITPNPVGNGSLFEIGSAGRDFLNANLLLWQTAHVGFTLVYQQQLNDGQNGVPFTLRLQDASTPTAVPEPGTMLLLGSGLAMAARRLRRRQ